MKREHKKDLLRRKFKENNKEKIIKLYGRKGVNTKKVKELTCLWRDWSKRMQE